MNGFLGQLAALTLHQIEALPPRLPGRFEADSSEPFAADPFDPPTQPLPPEPTLGPAIREPIPTIPNTAVGRDDAVGQRAPNFDPPFSWQPQTPAEQPAAQPLLTPVAPAIPPLSSRREIPAEPRTPTNSGTNVAAPAVEREMTRIEERVSILTQHERVLSREVTPVSEAAGRQRQPESEPLKPMNPLVAELKPIVPALTGFKDAATQQLADARPEPTPAPTIQVTIGRIEIRATQTSEKSAAKPRPAQATMSLDDYLKQRDGGRR
ncbi:hypothetical protein ACQE3E_13830 [Methylomonas sp. MED-D]|uniref:hypothetical protein n=1 Tax=unclassified Methylomonas TaxID=2608980 RepID=UPI0028A46B33|nr:hypothetical protein [Methylomonas sp. MV1]MDT4331503.1 hypothetical protein [Methylomonas sp. MV1]